MIVYLLFAHANAQSSEFERSIVVPMTISKLRSLLYWLARTLGDINAVFRGTVGKRIVSRVVGRVFGKLLGRVNRW